MSISKSGRRLRAAVLTLTVAIGLASALAEVAEAGEGFTPSRKTVEEIFAGFEWGRTPSSRPPKSPKTYESAWKPSARRGHQEITTTLYSIHSNESVPVFKGFLPPDEVLDEFFRCRGFGTNHRLDSRLIKTVAAVAEHFRALRVEIISAYRSPKFNDSLSKKGRNVAEESRHTKGEAVDFNLPGIRVSEVGAWLWENFEGGVGTYDKNDFVHIDVGPKRRWKGR